MNYKKLYQELLRTGDLHEMYFNMTGIWEEDSKAFKAQQEALESFSNNLDIYLDESE
jgi:hypothetical protein